MQQTSPQQMNSKQESQQDPFAQSLGIEIRHASFDTAEAGLEIQPNHCNVLGTVHGGVIFTLADASFAAACNSGDAHFIGLQTEIRFMRQAKGKTLKAVASLITSTTKLAHYQVSVADELGNPVAHFTSTAYKVGDKA